MQMTVGLIINFNVPALKKGIKRVVNNFVEIPNPILLENDHQ